jgi:trimethylamine:corrinoid methyltransferase-like protein
MWQADGARDLYARSNEKARRILSEHQVSPEKDPDALKDVEQLLASL